MKTVGKGYLWIVALFILVGIGSEHLSGLFGFVTENITTLATDNTTKVISTIKPHFATKIFSLVSVFSFTLAMSIFISVFISRKIEKTLLSEKRKELSTLQDAVNINVFDSLFKRLIPEEIFSAVKTDIISNKLIRRNANWIYDFRELDQVGEIELTQTVKYELHNISHEPIEDAITAVFDGAAGRCGLRRAVCMFEGSEIASYTATDVIRPVPDEKEINTSDDGKVTITRTPDGYTHVLLNVDIPPGKKMDVTVVYLTVYKNNYVNDGYFTKYPMIDATLTATYPAGYEFDIFQSLSSKMNRTLMEDNRSIYEVRGGILPRQGFIYSLTKKDI